MRLIQPSFEILEQSPGLEGVYRQVELAARNCYRSEPVEGVSSKDFVDRMIKSQHLSTLEHGTVYLAIPMTTYAPEAVNTYIDNPYSKVNECHDFIFTDRYGNKVSAWCVTTNLRVLVENDCLEDLEFLCEPTEFHEKRVTVRFTSNIHFYKDITRHRHMSFAIESTRYCNYSKCKFGNELTFIIPAWLDLPEGGAYWHDGIGWRVGATHDNAYMGESVNTGRYDANTCRIIHYFLSDLDKAQSTYNALTKSGWQAQQAAEVLPQATKADIIMTGFVSDWQHVFNLRTSIIAATGKPHPEVSRLMDPLYEEFETRHLI